MRTLTCSQAIRFTQGIITPTTSAAFETLLHEALHRHGFEGEWKTEQFAIAAMFTAGRLVRWSKAVNNGADRDLYWDGAAKEPGYNAVAYALIANEERPAEYRVTTQDVVRAIGLGWANSAY
jgi:hypothetical protein